MITRIFQGLAWLIVGGLALEFYLAGAVYITRGEPASRGKSLG